jgi:hypothetical protein
MSNRVVRGRTDQRKKGDRPKPLENKGPGLPCHRSSPLTVVSGKDPSHFPVDRVKNNKKGRGLEEKEERNSPNQNPKKEIPNPKNKERTKKRRNLHGVLTHCHVGSHEGAARGKQYPSPPRRRAG